MGCRLFGIKSLSEQILENRYLNPWEQISMKLESKVEHFSRDNEFVFL